MVRHFSKCGINNVMPNILEKGCSRDHYIHKAREQYYVELLEPQIKQISEHTEIIVNDRT